jgi:vacuolar-type H+-ATPase subunit H
MGFAYDEIGLPVIDAQRASFGSSLPGPHAWPIDRPIDPRPDEQESGNEIGGILLEVQRFADEAADEAERNARTIVDAARAEAGRVVEESRLQAEVNAQAIVDAARAEAGRVIEESRQQAVQFARATVDAARAEADRVIEGSRRYVAQPATVNLPSVSPEVVANLTNAITEFASTNRGLIDELVQLRNTLATPVEVTSHQDLVMNTPQPAQPVNGNGASTARFQ